MDDADKPLPQADLGAAFKALADAVRETYAPLFDLFAPPRPPKMLVASIRGATPTAWWFDESGLYRPAKRPPLIHNGRKPRK